MPGLTTDVAVVGAGVCGLSVAHALARRDVDFRVFEAAAPGSGQSAGRTRVFRHGHDDERLVRLAVRARSEWERFEDELGVRLLGRQGVLVRGPQVPQRAASFEAAGVPARLVGPDEQRAALPVFDPPADDAVLDELGGFIDVRGVIDSIATAQRDRIVSTEVFELTPCGDGVEIRGSEGVWTAGRAIVCAGVRTSELAGRLGLEIPMDVELHTRAAFRVREPGPPLACLQDRSGAHGETVYASPMPDGREYAIGLATADEPTVGDALERLRAYAGRAFPGLDPEPAAVRLCRSTVLPGGPDLVMVWRLGAVDVLAGANLFKFAPLLGDLLAAGEIDELAPEQRLGAAP